MMSGWQTEWQTAPDVVYGGHQTLQKEVANLHCKAFPTMSFLPLQISPFMLQQGFLHWAEPGH